MKRIRRGINFIKELESQRPICPVCDNHWPLLVEPSVGISAQITHEPNGYGIRIDVDDYSKRISRHAWRKINYCPMCGHYLGDEVDDTN